MLSCKDTTRLISRSMDASLPVAERIRLRLHILICTGCARYERQLLLIRGILRRPDAAWALSEVRAGETLSEEARERIRKSLRNA